MSKMLGGTAVYRCRRCGKKADVRKALIALSGGG